MTVLLTTLACVALAALLFATRERGLRRRLEASAVSLALRDALTKLPARPLACERLGEMLARHDRRGGFVAVLFLDLDRFKRVNASYGRGVGDGVLREASRRIVRRVRDGVVGHVGSDEFVVAVEGLAGGDAAGGIARDLLAMLQRPFQVDGATLYCTASIGIAVHPGDGTTAAALLQHAEIAMHRAKKRGRNAFEFFLPEMQQRAAQRLRQETALRGALERDEFVLHYQPKIDLETGEVSGFESLLRWRHPQLGLVAPAEFIPILEDTGLIVPVGEWVIAEACRQIASWRACGFAPKRIAVNMSAGQLRAKHLDRLLWRITRRHGVDPAFLELELTESSLMQDPEEIARSLAAVKKLGVRLAVDDFGTGYSSLAYLRRFPIDALKIDRAFVTDAARSHEDGKIAAAIVDLGHSLGLRVVAEGVETDEQLQFLRNRGCDEVQGFVISPPLEAAGTAGFLTRHAVATSCRVGR